MDGCNILPETQFVGTRLRVDTTRVFCGGSLPPWGAAGERSEFNIKPPLVALLLIFPRGYLLKYFPHVDTSARQRGFEIRVFPLLDELPKAIEPHLPVCQLYRWQLGPNMWSSPTTKSLDPIVFTALRVGFPGESHGPPHVDLPAIIIIIMVIFKCYFSGELIALLYKKQNNNNGVNLELGKTNIKSTVHAANSIK